MCGQFANRACSLVLLVATTMRMAARPSSHLQRGSLHPLSPSCNQYTCCNRSASDRSADRLPGPRLTPPPARSRAVSAGNGGAAIRAKATSSRRPQGQVLRSSLATFCCQAFPDPLPTQWRSRRRACFRNGSQEVFKESVINSSPPSTATASALYSRSSRSANRQGRDTRMATRPVIAAADSKVTLLPPGHERTPSPRPSPSAEGSCAWHRSAMV